MYLSGKIFFYNVRLRTHDLTASKEVGLKNAINILW